MRKFSDLFEAPQTIVFAFGRFNPPTTGHEKLINKVKSVAGNVPYRIYPSFTTNPKKDPLPHALKVAYMRKMFPKHKKNIIADKNAKTAIMIAEMLYKEGYKNLIMVAGSDRVKEFSELLNRYNDAPDKSGKQLFKFDTVQVISAGERDPDAEGVAGMSASKMRAAAVDGDKDAFLTGLPKGFKDGVKLYRDVRKYMGIREERDMGDMTDFETVRDMYLTGKIWNAGDIVEANGVIGEVVRKGTNYLSFVDEDGKVHKAWLHEITIDEEGISPALRRALDRKPMPQRYRVFDSKGEEVTVVQGPMKTKSSIDAFERRVKDKFIYTNPPYTVVDTKTNKVERMIEEVELNEKRAKQAVAGGKVQKYITGFGLKLKGKKYDEVDFERISIDNKSEMVTVKVLPRKGHPSNELSGEQMKIPFKMLRRGPFMATDVSKEELDEIRLTTPRVRPGGGAEGKSIEQSIKIHVKLMKQYMDKGMDKDKASKKAMSDVMNMKPAERKKFLAKEEVQPIDERNYRKEYDNYHSRPEQIARRSSRNKARRIMGDKTKIGMDVGHKDNDPMNNSPENLRNEDPSVNRREPRLREVDEDLGDSLPWLKKLKDKIFDKTHKKGLDSLSYEYAKRAAKEYKKNKRMNPIHIIHDIAKVYDNVSDRILRDHINNLVKKGLIPQELKAEYETQNETMSFKDFVNQIQINEKLAKDADAGEYIKDFEKSDAPQFKGKSKEKRKKMAIAAYLSKQREENVQQDSEIDDRKGTQPAKYHKGLSKSTKQKRDAHFKSKKAGPAPGDADAKTKPSVHTKKFKQMYGETVELDENQGLKNKAKKSGMPYNILKKVYDRGMAAYKTGHRPGTTPQQWAMARVNSFVTKSSGTWGGADKDLAKQVKEDAPCWDGYKQVGMKKKNGKNVPNCVPEENELNEWGEITEKAEYDGKSVDLNNPTKGDTKKYKVYVRNDKGNVVKVEFGDPNMEIKRDDPQKRASFRARHGCDNPGPKWKAKYWSCKFWSSKSVTDLMKG